MSQKPKFQTIQGGLTPAEAQKRDALRKTMHAATEEIIAALADMVHAGIDAEPEAFAKAGPGPVFSLAILRLLSKPGEPRPNSPKPEQYDA